MSLPPQQSVVNRSQTPPHPTPQPSNITGQHNQTIANFWGPFAGYGNRTTYNTWLLDNLGHRDADLHRAITQRFQQRQVPGSTMQHTTLKAKGVLVDKRPFYFVKRDITTVALYITQFGKDLFISQATYVKSPVSNARVIAVALMFLYLLIYPGWLGANLNGFFNGIAGGIFGGASEPFPIMLLCLGSPLYFLFGLCISIFTIFSIYKTITDKDPLAGLRMPPDEFDQDDTTALEKGVEETVRQALDAIGIQSNLMPKAQQHSFDGGTMRLI